MARAVLLAGGALLAAAGLVLGSGTGSTAPPASIGGAPLAGTTPTTTSTGTASKPRARGERTAFTIDLARIERVGERYEAPLADGRRATLTLDPELQPLAEKLLDEARAPRAAIVVMAPDGRILALAGRRTEDPLGGKQGTRDPQLALDVWAPAASIFKLVTASALVASGHNPADKVCFHGGVRSVMESNLADHKRDHRCETLGFGVGHSNNAILGKLAYQKLEPATLDGQARKLGWVAQLPAEVGFRATTGELALPTDRDLAFAKAAAGFHGARLSVLGGALVAATFANTGEQPVPRLVEAIAGEAVTAARPRRVLDARVAAAVGEMMTQTCTTGSAAKSFRKQKQVDVAGKTGTLSTREPFFIEHSWFVGYAPAEAPQVIVSVLLGNSERWHLKGHEAGRRLIDRATRRALDREATSRDRAASAKQ
jgi:penicillin-binding protein A